jgi:hypothetical protein
VRTDLESQRESAAIAFAGDDHCLRLAIFPSRRIAYTHSIVLSHGNALIWRRKFFLHTAKDRLPGPSEICAFDSKRKFWRFEKTLVSMTISNNRAIFDLIDHATRELADAKIPSPSKARSLVARDPHREPLNHRVIRQDPFGS